MAQLSRTHQLALAGVLVLALVGVLAMRLHGKGPSEAASSSPGSGASAPAKAHAAAAPTPIYHGPAPGVEGLTRDIAKAHGAVATSQQNEKQLQGKAAQASNEAPATSGGTPAASGAAAGTSSAGDKGAGAQSRNGRGHSRNGNAQSRNSNEHSRNSNVQSRKGNGRSSNGNTQSNEGSGRSGKPTSGRPAQQLQVEGELSHGKTVMLLFWDPKSSVDVAVRSEALALGRSSKGKVDVHVARANQVGLFGPVTEVAHVYQTPTILIVGAHHRVSTLTGLTDEFSLKQAVREAERAGA